MNTHQAKQLSLPALLAKLGFDPIKETKGGREYWYQSPFREEKDASFHTSIGRTGIWIWKDFADNGGTVIDFVMRYKGFSHISEALSYLDGFFPNNNFKKEPRRQKSFSFHQQAFSSQNDADRQLVFLRSEEIKNPIIASYLSSERKIPVALAKKYLKEVFYKNTRNDKEYFAIGMVNRAGGYEIRSASNQVKFKSVLIQRDISVIKGDSQAKDKVNVFEGMIDFLSYLVSIEKDSPTHDCLIMHSLSSFQKTADYIEKEGYRQIDTYLDNDPTGHEYISKFSNIFGLKHKPQNDLYESHRDLNDALVARQKGLRIR